jgi:hypothetical protein
MGRSWTSNPYLPDFLECRGFRDFAGHVGRPTEQLGEAGSHPTAKPKLRKRLDKSKKKLEIEFCEGNSSDSEDERRNRLRGVAKKIHL